MSFASLNLHPLLLQAVSDAGYSRPTDIQNKAIPQILKGRDLIAAAQTGTGKTASFVLPALHQLLNGKTQKKKRFRALVVVPTRELAIQIEQKVALYARHTPLTCTAVYGGTDEKLQKQALIEGCDILVATPGRLLDLYTQRALYFEEVELFVLDEADRMLDMGFIDDINRIVTRLPESAQHLLFSATLSNKVRDLAKSATHNPYEISIAAKQASKKLY